MIKSFLDLAVDAVTRRQVPPADLDAVTVRGDEAPSAGAADELWPSVEALYRTGMYPGIQVCIRHRGEVVVHRALGHARGVGPYERVDPERAVPLTLDTPVNLFSASKAVSAMAVHKLEEQEVLSIDDRVADHVPEFARHGKGEITLRQILCHRAGIPSVPGSMFDLDLLADPERMDAIVCDLRPTASIGGPPAYHAVVGGFVLEMVTRRTTGRSLRDVLEDEVRVPLGLERFALGVDPGDVELVAENHPTGLVSVLPLELFFHRAVGAPWERLLRMSNDPRFLTAVVPSGNVIVTAHDVARFYQCLLDGGELDGVRLFDEATVVRALEPQDEGAPFDRRLGMPMRYGAGFMLGSEQLSFFGWGHPRAFGHLGMSNMLTWADPERDLVVALLTTGKPLLGTHLVAFPQLVARIHRTFPAEG